MDIGWTRIVLPVAVLTVVGAAVPVVAVAAGPGCTKHASSAQELEAAEPGDVVCLDVDLPDDRLDLTASGTEDQPITYVGQEHAVAGLTVEAQHVVVRSFTMDEPAAPGIEATGADITLADNTIENPQGDDGDGIRFFGNDLTIQDNTVRGTSNDDDRHADCMQTFASDTPPSKRVLIEGNWCEDVDNQGLMAEGPNDGEGDGDGHSNRFTIRDNYFETSEASQLLMIEDVQHCVIEGNEFAGTTDKAIGLAIGSTGAHVEGNKVGPDIGYEVGIDDSSMPGYEGPEPGGPP